jgi:hypothetical protein
LSCNTAKRIRIYLEAKRLGRPEGREDNIKIFYRTAVGCGDGRVIEVAGDLLANRDEQSGVRTIEI